METIDLDKDSRGHWVVSIDEHEFHLPPRFDNHTAEQVINLPVQVVQVIEGRFVKNVYSNLVLAVDICDLSGFCGPMADMHEGAFCLRFESREAYAMLSN